MSRYRYNSQADPPAPYLLSAVAFPGDPIGEDWAPGLLDTGADATVIPRFLVERYGLLELDRRQFRGVGSGLHEVTRYLVNLRVRGLERNFHLPVLAVEDEPTILIGRDVLNLCRVVLDGPSGRLEIQ